MKLEITSFWTASALGTGNEETLANLLAGRAPGMREISGDIPERAIWFGSVLADLPEIAEPRWNMRTNRLLALASDALKDEIESALGETPLALAYPGGAWDELAQAMLNELGVKMTFSTEVGMNTVIKGLPQSLYALKRYNINGDTTDEALKSYLDGSFTQ